MVTTAWTVEDDVDARSGVLADHARGVRWETGFLTTPDGELFVSVHAPTSTVRGAFVICSPILAEAARNYRREVELADRLAGMGIVAARFHHLGAGHSDDAGEITLDGLVADAQMVAAHVRERSSVDTVGLLGTRLGALVAARVHQDHSGAPVVLWDPAVDGAKYTRDLLRARLMTNLKSGATDGGISGLKAELEQGRTVEISGYALTPELYRSLKGVELAALLGTPSGPLSIQEMNGAGRTRREVEALIRQWSAAGHRTASAVVDVDEPWWFGATARMDVQEGQTTAASLVSATVAFVDECLAGRP